MLLSVPQREMSLKAPFDTAPAAEKVSSKTKPMGAKKPSETPVALASVVVQPSPESIKTPVTGDKYDWMRAAGIAESDWQYVDFIVGSESGWDPCAYNPSQSDCSANPTSACGLAQSLPCGKQSKYGHWTDPVANLKWQKEYVAKYGGYEGAYYFWVANHWY